MIVLTTKLKLSEWPPAEKPCTSCIYISNENCNLDAVRRYIVRLLQYTYVRMYLRTLYSNIIRVDTRSRRIARVSSQPRKRRIWIGENSANGYASALIMFSILPSTRNIAFENGSIKEERYFKVPYSHDNFIFLSSSPGLHVINVARNEVWPVLVNID